MAYKPKILAFTDGGTNSSLTASNGGILYSNASATAILSGTATANQVLLSGSSTTPAWSTATYPATAGTSGNVLTSDGTNWSSSAAATGPLITVTGTLTNSQIKSINATPIQAIAAPGANKILIVVRAAAKFIYGGNNVFTAAASQYIDLFYNSNTTDAMVVGSGSSNGFINNAMIVSSASKFSAFTMLNFNNKSVGQIDNVNLAWWNANSEITGNAANDNTISWSITYYVASL